MPQTGGHLIIADKVISQLPNPSFIANNRNAYNLGAIGPDLMLFLFDPLGESKVLNVAIDLLTNIREIVEVIDETVDKITGPADDFADWVTGGLSTSIQGLISKGYLSLKTLLEMTIIPGGEVTVPNPFAELNGAYGNLPTGKEITVKSSDLSLLLKCFGHPYTSDPPCKSPANPGKYENWWWVDLLHYRRTGRFADALVKNAGTNEMLQAYSTGYWTHVGADICGHPFVNAVVGGPYRTHVLRHMVLENMIDSWIWDHYQSENIINSGMDKKVDVGSDFTAIAEHLLRTMDQIYTNPSWGGMPLQPKEYPNSKPGVEDFERAYKLMMLFLDLSTNVNLQKPIPPPGSPDEFFKEIMDSISKTATNIVNPFKHIHSFWDFLLALFCGALNALVLIIKILTLPEAILVRLATLAPRWFLYHLEMCMYVYITDAHYQLALSGWGKVSSDDLARPISQLALRNPPDRSGVKAFNYPYQQIPHNINLYWLYDPMFLKSGLEPPKCEASPYPPLATPDIFIDGPPYDIAHDRHLHNFGTPERPEQTINLEHEVFPSPQFGNAVTFAAKLIKGEYPPVSFDLDVDRGYGFLCWDPEPGTSPPNIPPRYDPKNFL